MRNVVVDEIRDRHLLRILPHALALLHVKEEHPSLLQAHASGHHALPAARDEVGRPLAARPGVAAILTPAARRETDVAGDAINVTLALVLFVVA